MNLQIQATPNYLPANIKALRKMCCLSQEELGLSIGLNRGNISSYESGSAEPKLCNLIKISSFFNLRMGDLTMQPITGKDQYNQLLARAKNIGKEEVEVLEKIEKEVTKYTKLIESSAICFQHFSDRINKGDDNNNFHSQYVFHYNQLHKITLDLLENYKEMLNFCKES